MKPLIPRFNHYFLLMLLAMLMFFVAEHIKIMSVIAKYFTAHSKAQGIIQLDRAEVKPGNILSVTVPMNPDFTFMSGRVENKILHNEETNTYSLDYGDGRFTTSSRRTTFWLHDGVVERITLLPLNTALPYRDMIKHMESLFLENNLVMDEYVNPRFQDDWDRYKRADYPGPDGSRIRDVFRMRFNLSDSVTVVLEMRQAPREGWYYSLTFTTGPFVQSRRFPNLSEIES